MLDDRDHFALAALAGFMSYPHRSSDSKSIAETVYTVADAMMARREQNRPKAEAQNVQRRTKPESGSGKERKAD